MKSVAGYESHYATFRWNPLNTMSCNFTMNERVDSAFYNNTDRQTVFLIAINSGAASCVMTLWETVRNAVDEFRLRQNITMYVEGNFSDPTEALSLTMFESLCRHSKSPALIAIAIIMAIVITNLVNYFSQSLLWSHVQSALLRKVPVPQKVKTVEFGLLPEGFLVFTGQDAFLQTLTGKITCRFGWSWIVIS